MREGEVDGASDWFDAVTDSMRTRRSASAAEKVGACARLAQSGDEVVLLWALRCATAAGDGRRAAGDGRRGRLGIDVGARRSCALHFARRALRWLRVT